jgi:hypothetical protein
MKYWVVQFDAISQKTADPRIDGSRKKKLAIWMRMLRAASARQAEVAGRKAAVL